MHDRKGRSVVQKKKRRASYSCENTYVKRNTKKKISEEKSREAFLVLGHSRKL